MEWTRAVGIGAGVVGGVGALFVLGGFLIDGNVVLETEVVIAAPPERVYWHLSSQQGVITWWTEAIDAFSAGGYGSIDINPAGGPPQGVGSVVTFSSGDDTYETWTITAANPPASVTWDVEFTLMSVERTFELTGVEGGTRLHWRESGFISNPVYRYFKLMMSEDGLQQNFGTALDALEAVCVEPSGQ